MASAVTDDGAPIVYPDSDGMPMAENDQQRHLIETLDVGFAAHFADREDVYTSADLLWYPVEGQPRINRAPDNLVVFGRPPGQRRSWKQWEEGGLAPQVVFEILSQSNTATEMNEKRRWYERYGVDELIVFDPAVGTLEVYERGGDLLVPRADAAAGTWTSHRLGLRFEAVADPPDDDSIVWWWLDVVEPGGRRWIRSTQIAAAERAAAARADAEARRADAEASRADAEATRADAAANRADALAAQLRALGVDPSAP